MSEQPITDADHAQYFRRDANKGWAEVNRLRAINAELLAALEMYEQARSHPGPSWPEVDCVVRAAIAKAKPPTERDITGIYRS